MIAIKRFPQIEFIPAAWTTMRPRGFGVRHLVLALLISLSGAAAQAQTNTTAHCIIAANDGGSVFRTDEITGCRINISNGAASFVINQEKRTRSYTHVRPLKKQHLKLATSLLNRVEKLRVPASTNPARFDVQDFLRQASKATDGMVFVRAKRKGGRALNVVYITDGVYRSIDFPGTNLNEMPSGFLTTKR